MANSTYFYERIFLHVISVRIIVPWLILWTITSYHITYYPITSAGNVNYCKSVHYSIPTCENREYPGFQNKSVSSAFNWVSRYIFVLAKLKGRRRPFLEGARSGAILWDYPPRVLGCHNRWQSFSFCEIWNNPTPSLFFIRLPYS